MIGTLDELVIQMDPSLDWELPNSHGKKEMWWNTI
jgi:hypothetical protein